MLSDREQKQLIYRRKLQFGTGDVLAPLVSSSVASELANKKSQVTKALKDVQSKTATGSLQQMMLNHFRETVNPTCFYSLPMDVAKTLPIKQLKVALTTMLSVKGKATQPSGTLPLGDEHQSLPLKDRVPVSQEASSSLLGPLEDDAQMGTSSCDGIGAEPAETDLDLEALLDHCACDGQLVFKIADKSPHLKKRPLHSVDNLLPSEVAIRLYRAEKVNETDIQIFPTASPEVPLVQFFSGNPQLMIDKLLRWKFRTGFQLKPCGQALQQRFACPLTLQSVDLQKNLKPTPFELYLELRSRGWEWKTWGGKPADLKKLSVDLDPLGNRKRFYGGGFHYLLCLVALPSIADKLDNKSFLMHGQSETYYQTAFLLAQRSRMADLQQLRPNQQAWFYRTWSSTIFNCLFWVSLSNHFMSLCWYWSMAGGM